ncbi:hypothetical protein D1007_58733 [Hordeum vulgare]|nr:hypothetical protein D1007_58733 [Hordeum vulgare]
MLHSLWKAPTLASTDLVVTSTTPLDMGVARWSRNLPSNWDHFEEEREADDAAEWVGEVAPRSMGADFAFLVEQAQA